MVNVTELQAIFIDCGTRFYHRNEYHKLRKGTPLYNRYHNAAKNLGLNRVSYSYSPKNDKGEFTSTRFHHDGKHYRISKRVKATYRDKLHTLIHELVHYRFPSLTHGKKFEQRTKEILQGKTFPPIEKEEKKISC